MPSAAYESLPRSSAPATPDVVDLRLENTRPMEGFADEPAESRARGDVAGDSSSSTLTYERYYGLAEKPFSLSTDPRFLYRSAAHTPVLRDLAAAIRRREGLIVVTGDIGTGKTTVCRAVLGQLDRKTFATFVPDPFVTREDLLKSMLIEFGVMSVEDLVKGRLRGASRPDLSYPLYEFLQSLEPLDAFAVLVIDEAQNLSLPLLEEIRILSDLEMGRKLLQVVLIGQPEFDEHLRLPRMRQIEQRVSVHCQLQPLDREGLSGYVSHRLRTAGASAGRLRLSEDALDLVFAVSGGVPRVVNLLCDKALAHGERAGAFLIGPAMVRAGLADLRLRAPVPAAAILAEAPPPARLENVSPPVFVAHAPVKEAPAPVPVDTTPAPVMPKPEAALRATTAGSGLDALLDLPAVDLEARLEEPRRRSTKTPPRSPIPVTRGKVWHASPRLGTVAASALVVLGATTGVSLVAYWMWLRPMWSEPIDLPGVKSPAVTLSSPGPVKVDQPRAASTTSGPAVPVEPPGAAASTAAAPIAPASEEWAIQTGVFAGPERAEVLVGRLTGLGYPAFRRTMTMMSLGRMHLALVGPFSSREEADAWLARLRAVPGFEESMVRRLPSS